MKTYRSENSLSSQTEININKTKPIDIKTHRSKILNKSELLKEDE